MRKKSGVTLKVREVRGSYRCFTIANSVNSAFHHETSGLTPKVQERVEVRFRSERTGWRGKARE